MGKGTRATAGHMPLTHHERTKKFTVHSTSDSADYGTTSIRLAGHSQYQIGTCALTTQSLLPPSVSDGATTSTTSTALCSPSGYIYDETSILEYLLRQTQQIKQRQQEQEQTKNQAIQETRVNELNAKKRQIDEFDESQRIIKRSTRQSEQDMAKDDLHRVSYWLSAAQPVATTASTSQLPSATQRNNNNNHNMNVNSVPNGNSMLALTNGDVEKGPDKIPTNVVVTAATSNTVLSTTATSTTGTSSEKPIPERPVSPMTGQPLLRRDLWPVQLEWSSPSTGVPKVKCAISDRILSTGAPVVAYWTTKKPHGSENGKNNNRGVVVLQSVFEQELQLHLPKTNQCPITDRTIRQVRVLQRSGSSYAASGQNVMSAKQYKPTIT